MRVRYPALDLAAKTQVGEEGASVDEPTYRGREDGRRAIPVAGSESMPDTLLHVALIQEPVGGTEHEGLDLIGCCDGELTPQGVAEQWMTPVPLSPVVECGDEEVAALELDQDRRRISALQDRVANWSTQPPRTEQRTNNRRCLSVARVRTSASK